MATFVSGEYDTEHGISLSAGVIGTPAPGTLGAAVRETGTVHLSEIVQAEGRMYAVREAEKAVENEDKDFGRIYAVREAQQAVDDEDQDFGRMYAVREAQQAVDEEDQDFGRMYAEREARDITPDSSDAVKEAIANAQHAADTVTANGYAPAVHNDDDTSVGVGGLGGILGDLGKALGGLLGGLFGGDYSGGEPGGDPGGGENGNE
ncbi:MAG TPA: hypothetical protein VFA53_06665, partial [Xanthobacteraceae bacterium]|nr:hypothetical protein [Xanthobacteraceae bacterium]